LKDLQKILISHGDSNAIQQVRDALGGGRYKLEEACTAAETIQKLAEFRPDVVLADAGLKGMDGLGLMRHLASEPQPPLVVLITAKGLERTAVQALREGAHNFILWPFDAAELEAVTHNALEQRRLLRENESYEEELQHALMRLRNSQAALVQAEKLGSMGKLVAGVAHELNTPLGVLRSSTDTIERASQRLLDWARSQEPEIAGQVQPFIDILSTTAAQSKNACDRITGIVTNLRQFAQLDRADLQRAHVHDSLESTLALLNHEFNGRVEVVKEFGDLPEIECSPRQLNQLFMNLLLNANEAIRQSGRAQGVIRLRTWQQDDWLKIEISDNGVGISGKDMERIFDPGFTTKGGVKVGTGLGLPISYQIVKEHHGRIEVVSRPGQGSRFTIVLPLEQGL